MSPRTVAELQELVASGARVKYLHFWGHRPQADGSVGSGALSQWWPSPFTVDGRTFATAEHFMMWSKATLFGDAAAAAEVLTAPHPHRAKAIGRGVKGFDQSVWKQHRSDIVTAASLAKFGQHPTCGPTWLALASGCWSRPARATRSGELVWPPMMPGLTIRTSGEV